MSFDDCNYHPEMLTSSGYLKHHAYLSVRPTPESVARLKRNGIIYKPGKFTKEEDDIIKRNWEAYRDENNLTDDSVDLFLPRIGETERIEKWDFIRKTAFYPKICKGLLNRYGQQIGVRFFKLYDQAIRKGYKQISYDKKHVQSEHKDSIIYLRFQKKKSMYSIAEKFRLTVTEVRNTCTKFLIENKRVSNRMYKKFLKTMENQAGREIVEKIFQKSAEGNLTEALALSSDLPFKAVADEMKKSIESLKDNWNFILKVMARLCIHFKSSGSTDEEAYNKALRCIITKKKPKLTNEQFAKFLKLLLKQLNPDSVYTGAVSYNFDRLELQKQCIKHMIFLFHTIYKETDALLKIVVSMLNHIRYICEHVDPPHVSLYDRVAILYEYYNNISDLVEEAEPSDKLWPLYRDPLLDTMAVLLSKKVEETTVPRKWKKYMKEEHHERCR
ncbi:unnamed protein product [Auanema sp. JU1783]|nr:unnamed protein product [Auanema sp. JU1783]